MSPLSLPNVGPRWFGLSLSRSLQFALFPRKTIFREKQWKITPFSSALERDDLRALGECPCVRIFRLAKGTGHIVIMGGGGEIGPKLTQANVLIFMPHSHTVKVGARGHCCEPVKADDDGMMTSKPPTFHLSTNFFFSNFSATPHPPLIHASPVRSRSMGGKVERAQRYHPVSRVATISPKRERRRRGGGRKEKEERKRARVENNRLWKIGVVIFGRGVLRFHENQKKNQIR